MRYHHGQPERIGVYACLIPMARAPGLYEDVFLYWDSYGRWSYLGADVYYRGQVRGWIGPLPRINDINRGERK